MCKVKLVLQNKTGKDRNTVNHADVEKSILDSRKILETLPFSINSHEEDYDIHINRLISDADAILDPYQ